MSIDQLYTKMQGSHVQMRSCILLSLLLVQAMVAEANHPGPLQDICVADLASSIHVNGYVCKSAAEVTVADFVYHGLDVPGDTRNPNGQTTTRVFAENLPGLNTQGVSMGRVDFAVGGINLPHVHPRASEVFLVMEGALYVGFVTSSNRLFATTLRRGDVFTFPRGLVHFQLNVGGTPALAFASFNSQNPGVQQIAPALLHSTLPIGDKALRKSFRVDQPTLEHLRSNFRV